MRALTAVAVFSEIRNIAPSERQLTAELGAFWCADPEKPLTNSITLRH